MSAIDAEFLQSGFRIYHGVLGWMNIKVLTLDYQADMPENWELLQKSSRLRSAQNPIYHRIISNISRGDLWAKVLEAHGDLQQIGVEDTVEFQTEILASAKNIWKAADGESEKKVALESIKTMLKNSGWSKNKWLDVVAHAEQEQRGGASVSKEIEEQLLCRAKTLKEQLGNLVGQLQNGDDDGAFLSIL